VLPVPQTGQEYDEEGLRRTVEEQVKTAQVMTWLQQNIKVTIQPWQVEGGQAAAAAAEPIKSVLTVCPKSPKRVFK
jgi:hypothetical protein